MNRISGRICRSDNKNGVKDVMAVLYDIDIDIETINRRDLPASDNPVVSNINNAYVQLLYGGCDAEEDSLIQGQPHGDQLGSVVTDSFGGFSLDFDDEAFTLHDAEKRPDLVLVVVAPDRPLGKTDQSEFPMGTPEVMRILHISLFPARNIGRNEHFLIELSPVTLERHGISEQDAVEPDAFSDAVAAPALRAKAIRSQLKTSLKLKERIAEKRQRKKEAEAFASRVSAVPHAVRQDNYFVFADTNLEEIDSAAKAEGLSRITAQTASRIGAPMNTFTHKLCFVLMRMFIIHNCKLRSGVTALFASCFLATPAALAGIIDLSITDRDNCRRDGDNIRDIAFLMRIGVTSDRFPTILRRRIDDQYVPRDVRLRNEPYKTRSKDVQHARALEAARSINPLTVDCDRWLVGGNGRAFDQISTGFETRPSLRYFDEKVTIATDTIKDPFEANGTMRQNYISRAGTLLHEIFHNWSYDHKLHGSDQYNDSMNQVVRKALQDVLDDDLVDPGTAGLPEGCENLSKCRELGFILLRRGAETTKAFDPLRRSLGLIGLRPGESRLTQIDGALHSVPVYYRSSHQYTNRAYYEELVRKVPDVPLRLIAGGTETLTPRFGRFSYRPSRRDRVVATSDRAGRQTDNMSPYMVVRTATRRFPVRVPGGIKILAWDGEEIYPNVRLLGGAENGVRLPGTGGTPLDFTLQEGDEILGFLGEPTDLLQALLVQRESGALFVFIHSEGAWRFALPVVQDGQVFTMRARDRITVNANALVTALAIGDLTPAAGNEYVIGIDDHTVAVISVLYTVSSARLTSTTLRATFSERLAGGNGRLLPTGDFNGDGIEEFLVPTVGRGVLALQYDSQTHTIIETGVIRYRNESDVSAPFGGFNPTYTIRTAGRYDRAIDADGLTITRQTDRRGVDAGVDAYRTWVAYLGADGSFVSRAELFPAGQALETTSDQHVHGAARSGAQDRPNLNFFRPGHSADLNGDGVDEIVMAGDSYAPLKPDGVEPGFIVVEIGSGGSWRAVVAKTEHGHGALIGHRVFRRSDRIAGVIHNRLTDRDLLILDDQGRSNDAR